MTRSFVLKAAGVVLAASVLLGGGLFGLRFDTPPQATAAPVPKVEMAKADEITDGLLELVSIPAVQRELKLSADARVKLIDGFDALQEEAEKPVSDDFLLEPPMPRPTYQGPPKKLRRELVAGNLTKGQFTRLQQCEVQVLNTRALLLKRVQDELGMTADQVKDMTKAMREADDRYELPLVQQGGQGGLAQLPAVPNGPPLGAPVSGASREEWKALDEVVKNFTAGQEKKWKELNGEKVGFNVRRVSDQCVTVFTQLRAADPEHGAQPLAPAANPPVLPLPPPRVDR